MCLEIVTKNYDILFNGLVGKEQVVSYPSEAHIELNEFPEVI